MKVRRYAVAAAALCVSMVAISAHADDYLLTPTKEDRKWLLPKTPSVPADNAITPARVELGKTLFFDPRLSSDRNLSCAGCHNPMFGWSDGLPTAKGHKSKVLGRATPTIVNSAFTTLQMWDGRKSSLEDQATGPIESPDEMAADVTALFKWLNDDSTYKEMFAKAYPGEAIDSKTLSKAIASFERTVISNDSPFDRWLEGDKHAMTKQQIIGFRLFTDPKKGNCAACHQAPNFTDGGFHNLGLASYQDGKGDAGRFAIKPIASMKGAFKTSTLRDVALTAPYFHDGSAKTLEDVVEHYNKGGVSKVDLSPNVRPLNLTHTEVEAIASFMRALTSPQKPVALPKLPLN